MDRAHALRSRAFRRDVRAWAALLLGGSLAIGATHLVRHRAILDDAAPSGAARDPRVVVLAYDRVVTQPDGQHLDRARLAEQLDMLAALGLQPVTLRRLALFYAGRATLPPRAVLLTFDHGYLSTARAVDPLLRERKWPAAMFVMTERQARRDPFFVYWPELERMVDSGVWEVGSHGHQGHNPLRLDAAGTEGPFFLRRAWLDGPARPETGPEFALRVDGDHRRAKAELAERLGEREPVAYAPPLRDVALASVDPEIESVNEELVRSSYALAFVDDPFGVNDRLSEPHHLRRVRVGLSCSAAELRQRLAHALRTPQPDDGEDSPSAQLWAPGSGTRLARGPEIVVSGAGRADAWRAGSPWAEDWLLEADVRVEASQFWVVQEARDLSQEWRFGGDERGTFLQVRKPAHAAETLEAFDARVEPGRWHRLRIVRRGAGVWAEWDGVRVGERPSFLPGPWRGNVGLVAWGGERTELRLRRVRFAAYPYRLKRLSPEPDEREVQAALREASTLSAVSPRWLEASAGGLVERALDRPLLGILARRGAFEVVPSLVVRPRAAESLEAWLPQVLARTEAEGWSGLSLDLGGLPPERREELAATCAQLAARERFHGRLLFENAGAGKPRGGKGAREEGA